MCSVMCKSVVLVSFEDSILSLSKRFCYTLSPIILDPERLRLEAASSFISRQNKSTESGCYRTTFPENCTTIWTACTRISTRIMHNISKLVHQAVINLAEQHGKEGAITQAYRDYMHLLKSKDVQCATPDISSHSNRCSLFFQISRVRFPRRNKGNEVRSVPLSYFPAKN